MGYTDIDKISAQLGGVEINSSTTPSSTDVMNWIDEADSEINLRTGNLYSSSLISSEIYDWDNDGDYILRLNDPFIAISELLYSSEPAGSVPVWVSKTENVDFYTYGDNGEVEFIPSQFRPISGKKRFMVSYVKGSPTVPGYIQRLSTLMVAQRVVQTTVQNQAYANSGGDIQVGIIKIGSPSAFSMTNYNAMSKEIDDIFNNMIGGSKFYRIRRNY
jgi:hypothetical protein